MALPESGVHAGRLRWRHPGRAHPAAGGAAGGQPEARAAAAGYGTVGAGALRGRRLQRGAHGARAQGGASGLLKLAEAAYNRGDYQGAAKQFESAVQLEPANLKARLLLANALISQYVPGADPASPLVAAAQEQYREVLARDPGNKQAIDGMLGALVNTKRFADAHDWALKAIQADATNKFAYYTAGFLDWSMAYPDYAGARQAAGIEAARIPA